MTEGATCSHCGDAPKCPWCRDALTARVATLAEQLDEMRDWHRKSQECVRELRAKVAELTEELSVINEVAKEETVYAKKCHGLFEKERGITNALRSAGQKLTNAGNDLAAIAECFCADFVANKGPCETCLWKACVSDTSALFSGEKEVNHGR